MSDLTLESIYNELWGDDNIPASIEKVWDSRHKKDSKTSYQFKINGIDKKNIKKDDFSLISKEIKSIFNLDCPCYEKMFNEACLGQGQEYKEIMRLHSSSLCAFLFFSNISKENKLVLELEGQNIEFHSVIFEYKNKVINYPSNIDIVLIGNNLSTKKDVIFFLESKFSEYLKTSNSYKEIGLDYLEKYSNFYNDNFLNRFNIELCKNDNGEIKIFNKKKKDKYIDSFGIKCKDNDKTYLDGVKQMISHYIGVEHFFNNDLVDERLLPKTADIYLGEILFDFNFEIAKNAFNSYSKYYEKLADSLNKNQSKIHVLKKVLKYSLFKTNNYRLSEVVQNFYFGKNKN